MPVNPVPDDALLTARMDLERGCFRGAPTRVILLSEMRGYFADQAACDEALARDDQAVYQVSWLEPGSGAGDLHYGLGRISPGRVGREYFMTKGHLHAWRPAAEVYIGLRGRGCLLLEDETTGRGQILPLDHGCVAYVPAGTAHRTVNTGEEPLLYLGVYPAAAGHDYGAIATRNFLHVVVERGGQPAMIERAAFLKGA
jgi:glucose-6-phosphate isomerase